VIGEGGGTKVNQEEYPLTHCNVRRVYQLVNKTQISDFCAMEVHGSR